MQGYNYQVISDPCAWHAKRMTNCYGSSMNIYFGLKFKDFYNLLNLDNSN